MPAESRPHRFGVLEPSKWPGERLGLPEDGELSVGRLGRRVIAIVLDWGIAMLIALLLAPYNSPVYTWFSYGIFLGMQVLFIPTIGGSIGHRIAGLRVMSIADGWVGIWRPIVRTILLGLIIPLLVWDSDQRGFHDKIAGTVLVRS